MALKILFARSLPLDRDSRSSKMVTEYRRRGYHVTAVVWSRGEPGSIEPNVVTCTAKGDYGRRMRGLRARLEWLLFLTLYMIRNRGNYDVIHVVDLDTAIVGVPLGKFLRKPVVYDAYDHISAIIGIGIIGRFLSHIERLAINRATLAIFPDVIRLEQYGVRSNEKIKIIGNIPEIQIQSNMLKPHSDERPLRIVYMGTLEAAHRGLEYLPSICSELPDKIAVLVGGMGALEDYFARLSKSIDNLNYVGQQDYSLALKRMATADCLYGPYLLTASAHRYASPNKMYEHLALGKPLITNVGTPPAKLVKQLGSGFLFDGTFHGLQNLFADLNLASIATAGKHASRAWAGQFSQLRQRQLDSFFDYFRRAIDNRPNSRII